MNDLKIYFAIIDEFYLILNGNSWKEKITQRFWAWPLCNLTRFSKHFFMFFCSDFLNEFLKLFWFLFLFQLPGMNSAPLTNLKTLTSCLVWSPLKRLSSKSCNTWDCSHVNEVIKYRREKAPMHFCYQVRNQDYALTVVLDIDRKICSFISIFCHLSHIVSFAQL